MGSSQTETSSGIQFQPLILYKHGLLAANFGRSAASTPRVRRVPHCISEFEDRYWSWSDGAQLSHAQPAYELVCSRSCAPFCAPGCHDLHLQADRLWHGSRYVTGVPSADCDWKSQSDLCTYATACAQRHACGSGFVGTLVSVGNSIHRCLRTQLHVLYIRKQPRGFCTSLAASQTGSSCLPTAHY